MFHNEFFVQDGQLDSLSPLPLHQVGLQKYALVVSLATGNWQLKDYGSFLRLIDEYIRLS